MAKQAGMKYMVLTAKHHDGFCLFDSKYTEYKATNTKAGRDLVKEYVEAVRAEGLKVGLYFTLLDWYHDDYPHYQDRNHPMRNHPECGNENRDFGRYIEYMHRQVEEICTNYGQLDLLWFDFSYDDMRGEKWGATRLINMVRSLQPQVIIDNLSLIHIYGASRLQRIWHVDLPAIRPTVVTMLIFACGNMINIGFDKVFLMQNSMNLAKSEVIATFVYKVGLVNACPVSYTHLGRSGAFSGRPTGI